MSGGAGSHRGTILPLADSRPPFSRTRNFSMRTVRWLVSGLALMALLPTISAAQAGRLFKDSWFWGAKGGIATFSTTSGASEVSPMAGVDWLITRSRGALYVAAD